MCALPKLTLGFRLGIKIGFILRIGIKIQGQSMQTGLFELALRDRNMQVRFFWKVFSKS
jgi:hypothetical protein